jgi:hypothetical protein
MAPYMDPYIHRTNTARDVWGAPLYTGWAEGPFVTSRRFYEAVFRVIASPSWDGHITPNPTHNQSGWCLFAYGEYKLD